MSSRAPWLRPDELTDDQLSLYQAILGGPRAASSPFPMTDDEGRLHGPFNAMLLSPAVGLPLQELGAAIRYTTDLTHREREIAILTVAVERRCEFEWYAHELIGSAIGLTADELAALAEHRSPDTFEVSERHVQAATRSMVRTRDLDDATFSNIRDELGTGKLAELVTLVGYYDHLALSLNVWRTPLPEGVSPRFAS